MIAPPQEYFSRYQNSPVMEAASGSSPLQNQRNPLSNLSPLQPVPHHHPIPPPPPLPLPQLLRRLNPSILRNPRSLRSWLRDWELKGNEQSQEANWDPQRPESRTIWTDSFSGASWSQGWIRSPIIMFSVVSIAVRNSLTTKATEQIERFISAHSPSLPC